MSEYKDFKYKFDSAIHTATTSDYEEDDLMESIATFKPSIHTGDDGLYFVSSIPMLYEGEIDKVYLESDLGGMFDNFLSICAEDDFPDKMFAIALIQIKSLEKKIEEKIKSHGNIPMNDFIVRGAEIRESELLYDKDGLAVAIKSNGKILPIIGGDL